MATRIFKIPSFLTVFSRNFSNKYMKVEVDDVTRIATLSLDSPPVNSLTLESLTELQDALNELQQQKVAGVIITSSKPGIFTGGLDLSELQTQDKTRLKKFWVTFRDTFIKLYSTPLLTVAAINGHSPAGGCILSIACDYRVMTQNYCIGGNETRLGLIPPLWFMERVKDLIGHRQAELAFTQGKLFSAEEAYQIGLVDQVVESSVEGISNAKHIIESYANVPKKAREITKRYTRQQFLDKMISQTDDDIEHFISHVFKGDTQQLLTEFKRKLSKAI